MMTSSTMSAGRCWSASDRTSEPSAARIVRKPASARTSLTRSRPAASSSATRTSRGPARVKKPPPRQNPLPAEELPQRVQEAADQRTLLGALGGALELLEQLLLARGELGGNLDAHAIR